MHKFTQAEAQTHIKTVTHHAPLGGRTQRPAVDDGGRRDARHLRTHTHAEACARALALAHQAHAHPSMHMHMPYTHTQTYI